MSAANEIDCAGIAAKACVAAFSAAIALAAAAGEWNGTVWSDSFESGAAWPERRTYPKSGGKDVRFSFGSSAGDFKSTLHVTGTYTGKCDTAWHVRSQRVALPCAATPKYALSFSVCGSDRYTQPATGGDWRSCLFWYDANGAELTRAAQPMTIIPGGGFGRIRATDAVPEGAAAFAVQFGWNSPNVCEGREYRIADVRLELLPDDASCGIEMPDVKSPRIVRTSKSPMTDAAAPFRFRATDAGGVDWATLKVSVGDKDVTARCTRDGDEVSVLPDGAWPTGRTTIQISVADVEGNVSKSRKVHFVGEVPPAPDVSLRDDGMMIVDGKPFFSIGIYGFRRREMNGHDCDRGIAELAAAGFNTVHSYGIAGDAEFLAAVAKHGLRMWASPPSFKKEGDMKKLENKSIVIWYIGDDTSRHLTPQELADRDDNIHAVDPVRPTCQADAMRSDADVDNYENYAAHTDGFLAEVYPVYHASPTKSRHCVAEAIRDMERTRKDNLRNGGARRHFAWPTIQYFKGWGWGRFPTRDELFAMSFGAIIHGAQGINWYTYGGSDGPVVNGKTVQGKPYHYGVCWSAETWGNMTYLSSRIASLRPALETRTGPQPPAPIVLSGPDKDAARNPSISQLLKSVDGTSYLLTVNSVYADVRARFAPGAKGDVEVLWENRRIKPEADGSFADDFGPFAVHVYRFAATSSAK